MTWLEGFEEIWTNAVRMSEARLERHLDAGAAPNHETVRRVLESVNAHWRDSNHFYGVWLRDFGAAHPKAGGQFDAILEEMAQSITPASQAPSPILPIGGGLLVGAAAFGLMAARGAAPALKAIVAVAVGAGVALVWWMVAQGSRRAVRDQVITQVSCELSHYGERMRKLVSEADRADTAAEQ